MKIIFCFLLALLALVYAQDEDGEVCIQRIIPCPKRCKDTCIYPDLPCPKTHPPRCPNDEQVQCFAPCTKEVKPPCPESCPKKCYYKPSADPCCPDVFDVFCPH
ncbi:hypothetical protein G6F16_011371 [Rhizopus arrhizus]|nr:hypothetical protein G6F23_008143 [Rhizopus arrhizus]KAG0782568.1 hypothetical protein G6F21_011043 [Rhizopus arrhizus]KAG0806199.1 hypothetical protein G6F20_011316 [Rhizopus arrhizus]KAG0822441.1 hypothetical protein G6F19_011372 [Rhizopus arrhizus]KAG0823341.1 hypothetical protein G6F18_011357 [Rhizopus arrhizus]